MEAAHIGPPLAFSTDPSSEFYAAVKEVYDLSLTLNDEQKEQVIAWRDVPGGGHAHWLSILMQVLEMEGDAVMLDRAALIYVRLGISQSDARIATWKAKYHYNLLRPVTYIRSVMAMPAWNSFITTPNHPEYPSAHSSFSIPAAIVMSQEFGNNYAFTDHTYDFLGLPTRYYYSFQHAAEDAGDSRVLGGLHYRFSIAAGKMLGSALIEHMDKQIRFIH
ncbi:vanadium-dependent haloperoxidase [Flavihumibacter sp. ZG627]|uniref:vanadium-dependent haloperoxidase n=1 Tax=Flavihumibacter sp. ZG627 TaxID=1463156 RepID=UPI000693587C|nr:vanadium-dependent haloperoxidase [Flavihumibacter sp. ZG627]